MLFQREDGNTVTNAVRWARNRGVPRIGNSGTTPRTLHFKESHGKWEPDATSGSVDVAKQTRLILRRSLPPCRSLHS